MHQMVLKSCGQCTCSSSAFKKRRRTRLIIFVMTQCCQRVTNQSLQFSCLLFWWSANGILVFATSKGVAMIAICKNGQKGCSVTTIMVRSTKQYHNTKVLRSDGG